MVQSFRNHSHDPVVRFQTGGITLDRKIRVGVDVGGTFTDFVLVDQHRDLIFTGKRLTTHEDPSLGIISGLNRLLKESHTDVDQLQSIVHGTTLVSNTVIERKGAKVGLITTKGFRDSLEMGREIRYNLYDLSLQRPEPLVPRYLRRAVTERIDVEGTVLLPLDVEEFRTIVRDLVALHVDVIAICFIHSYRNDVHERKAKEIVAAEFPNLPVNLSSEIAPEIREFERTSTVCCNAYVQPLIGRYLDRLQSELKRMGLSGPLYIMLSGGGITTVKNARQHPVQIIESGPAAGAIGASFYSKRSNIDHILSFDMGGTTAKISLIEYGQPDYSHQFEAGRVQRFQKGSGLPLKVSVIDLIEIGAGGGSIAWIDQMGLMKVGPQSAGSEPGPVCYGLGGTLPTVTDADLLLGYLSPEFFLGGEMKLDSTAVGQRTQLELADPLGLSITEVAMGIHNIVNENMAAASRMFIAEKGRDQRHYKLFAFGGAGPVHAYGLAKLLKLKQIIYPLGAGVMSALGFMVAAPAVDLVRSYVARIENANWAHINMLYAEMEQEARELLTEAGASDAEISVRKHADMRYVGQGFEIKVPIPDGILGDDTVPRIRELFLTTYRQLFDREIQNVPIEALSWRLTVTATAPNIALNYASHSNEGSDAFKGSRQVYFPQAGYVRCAIYNRYALRPGTKLRGPALLEERESTAAIGPDAYIRVDEDLNLIVDIDESG
jgi:N-methylhydantoinase A